MFKITPISDPIIQKQCAEACNTRMIPGFFAYSMTDVETGRMMGFSQFEITDEGGYLCDIRECGDKDDFEAMFILARQTMNFIDLCGAHHIIAPSSAADERLLRAAGFKKTDENTYSCDTTGMFDGHCDHK